MQKSSQHTKYMVQLALMVALTAVVAFVPFLGFIPLGVIKATTTHIPVIIGAILLGPKAGAVLGLTMGITSIIKNTMEPSLVSFAFSPLVPVPGRDVGDIRALLVAILPRMCIGIVAGLCYKLFRHLDKRGYFACGAAGFLGALTNTILVMGGIYLFFGPEYMAAKNMAMTSIFLFILGSVGVQSLLEAALAAVAGAFVARPLINWLRPAERPGPEPAAGNRDLAKPSEEAPEEGWEETPPQE